MHRNSGGSVRQRRSRLFGIFGIRRAFTLVEVLAALLILAVLSGTIALAGGASALESAEQNPKKEAQRLARWLSKNIVTANRTGRGFVFFCSGSMAYETVRILWNDGEQETCAAAYGCRFIRLGSRDNIWSPQWSTFTPAFTIRVTNGRKADDRYVVVSAHGRVRTDVSPPP